MEVSVVVSQNLRPRRLECDQGALQHPNDFVGEFLGGTVENAGRPGCRPYLTLTGG